MLEAGTGVKMDLEAMILGELMLNAGVIVPLSRKVEFSTSGKDFYALTVRSLSVVSSDLLRFACACVCVCMCVCVCVVSSVRRHTGGLFGLRTTAWLVG
jgi:hypothetical protein